MAKQTPRELIFDKNARDEMVKGVNILADAVRSTLGPKGRNVVIQKLAGSPHITKDGVSVARSVFLEDPFQDMGAQMVKEAAVRACDSAGDGTTTATVLAHALINEGVKAVNNGSNPLEVKRGIDRIVEAAILQLKSMAIECNTKEDIKSIAMISANGDEGLANLITEAMDRVGIEGVVDIKEATGYDDDIRFVDGVTISRGYISPFFLMDGEDAVVAKEVFILIVNGEINEGNFGKYVPLLEVAQNKNSKLLILADDFDQYATEVFLNNYRRHKSTIPVRNPSFGDKRRELIQDLAKLVNAKVVDAGYDFEESGMDGILGAADEVRVSSKETVILGGKGDRKEIEERAEGIRKKLQEPGITDFAKKNLTERLAKLNSAIAVIQVSASSEIEMLERKDRADDAVGATRAALEEGYVPGGGVTLLRLSKKLKDMFASVNVTTSERLGMDIAIKAMEAPIRQIAENAAVAPDVVIMNVLSNNDSSYGFDARTEEYDDMIELGIIDPVKVTRGSLEYAASVATMMLTTQVMIAIKQRKDGLVN